MLASVFSLLAAQADASITVYLSYLASQLSFGIGIFVFLKLKHTDFFSVVPLKNKISSLALLFTIPITIGIFGHGMILAYSASWLLSHIGIEPTITVPDTSSPIGLFLAILVVCVLPAIAEETMFRGVLLATVRRHGDAKAIIISSLVFSLFHLNPAQLIYQFALAVLLCYIVIKTKNIIFGVVIHFLNNTFALTAEYIIPQVVVLNEYSVSNLGILAIFFVLGAVLLYPSLYFMLKLNKNKCDTFKALDALQTDIVINTDSSDASSDVKPKQGIYLTVLITVLVLLVTLVAITSLISPMTNT